MTERWLPILNWESYYEISNAGQIRSKLRIRRKNTTSKAKQRGGNLLKQIVAKNGYLLANLTGIGKRKQILVHRAVLMTFCGTPKNDQECCHNDGNRKNNNISNLRWGTTKENMADKKLHGTWQGGEMNGNAKLTDEKVIKIRYSGIPISQLAKTMNVSRNTICRVQNKKSWNHV